MTNDELVSGLPFDDLPVAISLDRQIACVEREIRFRERVYARRIEAGKMTPEKAAVEVASMRAVLETLKGVRDGKA